MTLFAYSALTTLNVKWSGYHAEDGTLSDYEHANPYWELMMVAEGPVFLRTGNEKHALASGDCFILRPWEKHTVWKALRHGHAFFWVQFAASPALAECRPGELARLLEQNRTQRSRQELRSDTEQPVDVLLLSRHYRPSRRYELLRLFEQLHKEMQRPIGYFRHRSSLLLTQLLHLLAEDVLEREHADTRVPPGYQAYRQLLLYLHEHFARPLQPAAIEALLDRRYDYVCHVFKQYSGMTISAYLQSLRMQRARHLLLHTNDGIQDIASEIGYPDPYYFSKIFRRHHGLNPTAFRQAGKEGRPVPNASATDSSATDS